MFRLNRIVLFVCVLGALIALFSWRARTPDPETAPSTAAAAAEAALAGRGNAGPEPRQLATRFNRAGRISGRVVDSAGAALAGARVRAAGPVARDAVAASDGSFLLEELAPGDYTLNASLGIRACAPQGPIPLGPGEELRDLALVLDVGAALSGVVRDARDESPIAGASVSCGASIARSDAKGSFRLLGLPSGSAVVSAVASGYLPRSSDVELVQGRERTGADIHLERAARVHGRVEASAGVVAGAQVLAARYAFAGGSPTPVAVTGPDGRFAGDVPPGRLQLLARADGWAESRTDELELTAGEEREVNLTLGPGGAVFGQVRDGQGAGVSGCTVEAFDAVHGRETGRAASGPAGQYWIAGIPQAVYQIAATCAQGHAETSGVKVAVGDQVQVDLQLGSASIGGKVVDGSGRAVVGAQILLRVDGSAATAMPIALSGPDGSFRASGLAGERFAVSAVAAQGSVERTGVAAGTVDLVLTLESGELVGQVVDERGGPVSDFVIYAEPLQFDQGRPRSQHFLSPTGDFRLALRIGRYSLKAGAPGFGTGTVSPVAVASSGGSKLRVTLTRGTTVRGRVVDQEGNGIAGARVATHANLLYAFGRAAPVPSGSAAVSDESGAFAMSGVVPGERVHLFARKEGYQQRGPTMVDVPRDQPVDGVEIRLAAAQNRDDDDPNSTDFAGVGMSLAAREDKVLVWDVFEGGSARQAGIRPGDQVVLVDGVPANPAQLNETVNRIRGLVGTTVQLVIRRDGKDFLVAVPRVPVKF